MTAFRLITTLKCRTAGLDDVPVSEGGEFPAEGKSLGRDKTQSFHIFLIINWVAGPAWECSNGWWRGVEEYLKRAEVGGGGRELV